MRALFRRDPLGVATFVLAVVAIGAALLASQGAQPPKPETPRVAPGGSAELIRCRNLGEAAGADPACHAAWADSRRRFFGAGDRL